MHLLWTHIQVETLTHQKWSGAGLVDAQIKTVQGGASSTLAMVSFYTL
jgi:isocitrate lyase